MSEQLRGGQSLCRLLPQQALQQTLGPRREALRQAALAPADLREEGGGVRVVEGIAPHQHGVQHYPQTPHVRLLAGVRSRAAEDLGADVGGTPMGVRHGVVPRVLQHVAVLQTLQFHLAPRGENRGVRTG